MHRCTSARRNFPNLKSPMYSPGRSRMNRSTRWPGQSTTLIQTQTVCVATEAWLCPHCSGSMHAGPKKGPGRAHTRRQTAAELHSYFPGRSGLWAAAEKQWAAASMQRCEALQRSPTAQHDHYMTPAWSLLCESRLRRPAVNPAKHMLRLYTFIPYWLAFGTPAPHPVCNCKPVTVF